MACTWAAPRPIQAEHCLSPFAQRISIKPCLLSHMSHACLLQTLSSVTTSSGGPSLFSTMMLLTGSLQVNSINVTSLAYMPGISTSDQAAAAAWYSHGPNIGAIVGPVVGGVTLLVLGSGAPCQLGLPLMHCAPAGPCWNFRLFQCAFTLSRGHPRVYCAPPRSPAASPARSLARSGSMLHACPGSMLVLLCHATSLCARDPAIQIHPCTPIFQANTSVR